MSSKDSTGCSTVYSNAAGATLAYNANYDTCSEHFSSFDKQLIACPNDSDICGTTRVHTFADKTAAKVTKSTTSFTQDESCTWVIKATCDSPGWEIDNIDHPEKISIHYYEYTSDITLENTDYPHRTNTDAKEKGVYND